MKIALAEFDAWAIVNNDCQFVENPTGGLFSRFFARLNTTAMSHIYLLMREGDDRHEKLVLGVRDQLKGLCLPVFYFRDGQILFHCSKEPATITAQRCLRSLNQFKHWAIVDSSGETHSSDSPAEVWEDTDLSCLFLDDDAEQEGFWDDDDDE